MPSHNFFGGTMSLIDVYRNSIVRKRDEIARFSIDKAREQTKLADLNKRANSASEGARHATSPSSLKSKMNEIARYEKDAAAVSKT